MHTHNAMYSSFTDRDTRTNFMIARTRSDTTDSVSSISLSLLSLIILISLSFKVLGNNVCTDIKMLSIRPVLQP